MIYLARIHGSAEFVGVFAANSISELFWLVDECTDPFACEVAAMPSGGGIYALGEASPVRLGDYDPTDPIVFNDMIFAGSWQEQDEDSGWKRFVTKEKLRKVKA